MTGICIGIIGVGSRGLTVFERIVAQLRAHRDPDPVAIHLFDPQAPGAGCHSPEQPEYLLVNTVASQITQFADDSVKDAGPIMTGPSFYQWLVDQQRIAKLSGAPCSAKHAEEINPDSYYSRRSFGRYLQWVYGYIKSLTPPGVSVHFHREQIVRLARADHRIWSLTTEHGQTFAMNFVFLTTGHTKPVESAREHYGSAGNSKTAGTEVISDPYPIEEKLSTIRPDHRVAIQGMGLSAFDVIAGLTLGRGGRFSRGSNGELVYRRSGNEPTIAMYSRSGIPLSARAVNQKGTSGQYRARFLTLDRVREIRSLKHSAGIDFVSDILPLLLNDMEYAYYDAYMRQHRGYAKAMAFCNEYEIANAEQRRILIKKEIPPVDRFNWDMLVNPVPASATRSRECFGEWLRDHLERDLDAARQGNVDNPMKAACDVLRDVRDTLRAAIDFGGLSEASHRWLFAEFLPIMNRLAVGPPKERIEEMLSLMQAGVLIADWGPHADCQKDEGTSTLRLHSRWLGQNMKIDVLIKARVSMHSPAYDASPLMQHLLASGWGRLFHNRGFHPGGIEIDRNFNLVTASGAIVENVWALGMPTEGAKFYTFVVPRPGVNSTSVVDAGRAVQKMFELMKAARQRSAAALETADG